MQKRTEEIALTGLLIALTFILSYLDSMIPVSVIPGFKIGLANIVVVYALYEMSPFHAITINIVRVILTLFMLGNFMATTMSFGGVVCSFVIMAILHHYTKLYIVTISELGALSHLIGQIFVGMLWFPLKVLVFQSLFLLVCSAISGIIIGYIASIIIKKTKLTQN